MNNPENSNAAVNSVFWSEKPEDLYQSLKTNASGLSQAEASKRLKIYGPNSLASNEKTQLFTLLIRQFASPIIIILMAADVLSFYLGDPTDAIIILVIVLISGLLGFFQEKGAYNVVAKLRQLIKSNSQVIRDGKQQTISSDQIVPGDIIVLGAGIGFRETDCLLKAITCLSGSLLLPVKVSLLKRM